nr:MAG TPA: hypothetical protein [Caudoviricetes sp.]
MQKLYQKKLCNCILSYKNKGFFVYSVKHRLYFFISRYNYSKKIIKY